MIRIDNETIKYILVPITQVRQICKLQSLYHSRKIHVLWWRVHWTKSQQTGFSSWCCHFLAVSVVQYDPLTPNFHHGTTVLVTLRSDRLVISLAECLVKQVWASSLIKTQGFPELNLCSHSASWGSLFCLGSYGVADVGEGTSVNWTTSSFNKAIRNIEKVLGAGQESPGHSLSF